MTRSDHCVSVHDALASHPVDTTVHRRLHDVRPHAVYEVRYDGRRGICKVKRHPEGAPALEGLLLAFVAAETAVPVPEVLAIGNGHFLAEWSPELPDDPTADPARLRATGRCMARLHEGPAEHFDAFGRPTLDDTRSLRHPTDDRWSDALCALLEDRRRFLEPRGYGDVALAAREFVEEHRGGFDDVGAPTLLHGNVLPEHVAVQRTGEEARVTCLIDFEHAIVGPPVFDVLRTLGPLVGPPSAEPDAPERTAFLEGYRSVRPLPDDLELLLRLHVPVNAVSYLRSLHLQRGDRDSRHAIARRARGLERHVRTRLAALRSELE